MTAPHLPTPLWRQLEAHEGRRGKAYRDSEGHLTIGVGHNLDVHPLSDAVIDLLLAEDIASHLGELHARLPWVVGLDEVRQRVLLDMAFNLGVQGLLQFTHFLAYCKAGEWGKAAEAGRASLWYRQVKSRGVTLMTMLKTGEDPFADQT